MPETICKTNESESVIKRELSFPAPEPSVCTSGCPTLEPLQQQSVESNPSPNQDEQELIDITTVKAEDSIITNTRDSTNSKTEVDNGKKMDVCTGGKTNDGGIISVDVKGEVVNASPFDSGSAQPSLPTETNNAERSALTRDRTSAAQSMMENNMVENSQTVGSSTVLNSTTNFEGIQNQLKKTLDHIEQRHMVSGFRTLSNATSAVVEHCEQLGLTSDDHPYNAIDREQFWAGLNNCWLYALAQRHEPSSDEEKMTDQQLCNLRERVVTWADKLERYGLVDYEMGWWEADILAAMDAILATNYASAQAVAQVAVAKAAAALFGDETNG